MFKSSQVMQLFPVFVWAQVLEDDIAGPLNEHLRQQVSLLKPVDADPDAPYSGWQTRNDLHTLPEFGQMNDIIHASARKVLEFLNVVPTPMDITGCWMNVKPRGAGHTLHSHPNNYLSGVYYVTAPEGADNILFHDFRMERHIIVPRFAEQTPANESLSRVPIKEGVLIMFPSWLAHSVQANPTDEERISLAFNVMFSDFTGTLAQPNWSPDSGNAST
ncbi:MAG: hypothetical protein E2O36_02740 [Proteobacteria bacterium]|nr:MAG: hypothetical protein E2O36_02740 [Pseudomonadota bacterium]